MRAVEMALRAEEERERAEKESIKRLAAVEAAEAALTGPERVKFLAKLIRKVEAESQADSEPGVTKARAKMKGNGRHKTQRVRSHKNGTSGKKTDMAEAFIFSRPGGATAAEVGVHVGQSANTAEQHASPRPGKSWHHRTSSRRSVVSTCKQGRVVGHADVACRHRTGAWRRQGTGNRRPFKAVVKLRSDAQYTSVAGEIGRMKRAGVLTVTGRGPNGGDLYTAKHEGSTSAAMN